MDKMLLIQNARVMDPKTKLDKIMDVLVKDGNIIEQGNHDELMKKNGFYAELYNSQFKK